MISEEERNRRLDANDGYLREKIKDVGYSALENLITMKEDPTKTKPRCISKANKIAEHCRFLARTWVDRNGDEISADAKRQYFESAGIQILDED